MHKRSRTKQPRITVKQETFDKIEKIASSTYRTATTVVEMLLAYYEQSHHSNSDPYQ